MTKCLNKQPEFRTAYGNGALGYYDSLMPLYASFHADDKTFLLMWTQYDDVFIRFYERCIENKCKYGENHGMLCQQQMLPPENTYTVSTLPRVSFSYFSVHSYTNSPYFFPSVESGKICADQNGRQQMPLFLTCHHATTDGWHVDCFLNDLNEEIAAFCGQTTAVR